MLKRAIAILLLTPALSWATLPATTVWEIRTDGSPTNGGGYSSARSGTDWSQTATPEETDTNGAWTHATLQFVSTGATFQTDNVAGNILCISDTGDGGHGTIGWYEITSVVNETTITLDREPTDGNDEAGLDFKVGGALNSPGTLGLVLSTAAQAVAGMKAYIRYTGSDYDLSGTTANLDGGPLDISTSQQTNKRFSLIGYDPAYGRNVFAGTRPTINCDSNAPTAVIKGAGRYDAPVLIAFIAIDGDNTSTTYGIDAVDDSCVVYGCYITQVNGTGAYYRGNVIQSKAYDCDANGFHSTSGSVCCVAQNCETGFYYCSTNVNNIAIDCTLGHRVYSSSVIGGASYSCDTDGFYGADAGASFINCVSVLDGGYSFNSHGRKSVLLNSAGYGASSGRYDQIPLLDYGNPGTLAGNPFADAPTDFKADATADEGLLLRSLGLSPYGQTGYIDIGAVQHEDTGSGGGETSHVWVR